MYACVMYQEYNMYTCVTYQEYTMYACVISIRCYLT